MGVALAPILKGYTLHQSKGQEKLRDGVEACNSVVSPRTLAKRDGSHWTTLGSSAHDAVLLGLEGLEHWNVNDRSASSAMKKGSLH